MLAALVAGVRDQKNVADLARRTLRAKIPALKEAFTRPVHRPPRFLLQRMLAHVDAIDADIASLDARIEEVMRPFADTAQRLDAIHGIAPRRGGRDPR